jgi:hypothetical protein
MTIKAPIREEVDKIKLLTPSERLAGYLFTSAKLAVFGARVRKNDKDDKNWPPEEIEEWDSLANEIDPWFYALTEQELQLLKPIESIIASISCADVEKLLMLI